MRLNLDITWLLRLVTRLLRWTKWRRRAKDAESKVTLDSETYDSERRIRDAGNTVERGHGSDDDLLGG